MIAVAFVMGRLIGQRTREAGRLADDKERLVGEQEERERAAIERERMRIAQELHDLITHRVSAMVLQAGTERHILERDGLSPLDPASLATALESIETLGREAMSELRHCSTPCSTKEMSRALPNRAPTISLPWRQGLREPASR